MQDNTESRNNPKDRNFDQEDVGGESKSTNGRKQTEEKAQDDYNAQDRNFEGETSGKPTATAHEPTDDEDSNAAPNRNIDPSLRQGADEEPHK